VQFKLLGKECSPYEVVEIIPCSHLPEPLPIKGEWVFAAFQEAIDFTVLSLKRARVAVDTEYLPKYIAHLLQCGIR